MSVADQFAFLDHPGPLAFAHRGGAGDWPENSMPAFENAVSLGYRYVETDVHVTSDGVLVAFHDDTLDRVTDGTGLIRDQTWATVSQARIDGREPIPRLEELLSAWPDLRVNIDPKHDTSVEPLIAAIRSAGAVERVCIGSFSDRRLRRVRQALGPGLCTSLGPIGIAGLKLAGFGIPWRTSVPCAQVPVRRGRLVVTDHRFVAAAHRRGMQVHVWTIDDPDEMNRLLDLGVDGIMTDRPAVLRQVLESRDQWFGAPA